ncbi:MAG: SPOR domain-containing protein, partial [Cyclobacteriaceae bacterium]|nr:SPOR domain-containing protein [Cyclobacteriaceae bacterium]
QDNSNDWGSDDDSFGLPEIDYNPIDRESEETNEIEEKSSEEPTDFNFQESVSEVEEGTTPEDFEIDYADDDDQPMDEGEAPKKSSGGVIMTIIVLVVVIGGVLGYMFWLKPMQDQKNYDNFISAGNASLGKELFDDAINSFNAAKETKPNETLPDELIAKAVSARDAAAKLKAEKEEADRLAAEEQERLRREAEEAAKKPKIGSIDKIMARTGRYFVVVASDIDEDLAMDFAKSLSKNGVSSKILVAPERGKFHRVTIADFDTASDAQEHANSIKGTYESAWIVKY